ncbi:MAG TPA: hypothetical protein VGO59_01075 [Verrucomicrobiae bacterium]|jgi:hypothetical protein
MQEWNTPKPEKPARPTWWPAGVAFGVTFIAWGLITSFIVLTVGLIAFVWSLAGWIGEINHERRDH